MAEATSVVRAAPSALDCRNVALTAPLPGSTLSGAVDVYGRALILDLQFYKVEYSPIGRDQWILIGTDVIRKPVESGRLVVWQTNIVAEGTYRLRLRVVDSTGNYCEAFLSPLQVSHARPTFVPSPTPTETPILTAVPPQATPTIRVDIPTEVVPHLGTPGALPTRSQVFGLPDFNVTVLAAFFVLGACGMFAVVLFIGLVMLIRTPKS
jgi:hypothetical protein